MNDIFIQTHPIFASFPFVILTLVFLTELVSYFTDTFQWRVFACFLVWVATAMGLVSYYTGFYSANSANVTFKISEELIGMHQSSAKLFILSMFPTALFAILRSIKQSEFIHWIYTPCLICSLLLAGLASHRGGMLVFKEGAGVERSCPETVQALPQKPK